MLEQVLADDPDRVVRIAAADAILELAGSEAYLTLSGHLSDEPELGVFRHVVRKMGAQADEEVIPVLEQLMPRVSGPRLVAIVQQLAMLGHSHIRDEMQHTLTEKALGDGSAKERARAIQQLARLVESSELEFLRPVASSDQDASVRAAARRALRD